MKHCLYSVLNRALILIENCDVIGGTDVLSLDWGECGQYLRTADSVEVMTTGDLR